AGNRRIGRRAGWNHNRPSRPRHGAIRSRLRRRLAPRRCREPAWTEGSHGGRTCRRAMNKPLLLLLGTGAALGFYFPLGKLAAAAGIGPALWGAVIGFGAGLTM